MTIDIEEISHPTTPEALAYAQDYYLNYYNPLNPLRSFHRYNHSDHIEVLVAWGYQGDFFVQSRIKFTVLYPLIGDWTDETAMRGWVFWRNPITAVWHTIVESHLTSVHHWQEAHSHIKQEATDMALKRARIDTYHPATHTADITIYPLPGETMVGVPLAQEIGPQLAALLPDCTLAIFYDTDPPLPYITSILNGAPPPWVTSALIKDGEIAEDDLADFAVTYPKLHPNAKGQVASDRATHGQQITSTTMVDLAGSSLTLVIPDGQFSDVLLFAIATVDNSTAQHKTSVGIRCVEDAHVSLIYISHSAFSRAFVSLVAIWHRAAQFGSKEYRIQGSTEAAGDISTFRRPALYAIALPG